MPLLLVEQLRDIQIYVQILRGKFSIIDCMLGKLCLYTIKLHNLHLETIVDLYIYTNINRRHQNGWICNHINI